MTQFPDTYTNQDKLNWEVEKLKREHRNLGWTFLSAILLALAAFIGTVANIYFSSFQKTLADIQKEKTTLEVLKLQEEKKQLIKDQVDLATQRDTLQADVIRIKQELQEIASQQDTVKRKQIEKLADEIQISSVAPIAPTTNLPARVYLQYLKSQENKVLPIVEELKKRGYVVSSQSSDSSKRKRELFVGYYYESDKEEADKLRRLLQNLSGGQISQQLTLLKGEARQRHYDVWIAFPSD